METSPVPESAHLAAPTGDARSDRWREHRATVRLQLIEATLEAIEQYGPDVLVDDIARLAGVPKPKVYRYFADKGELFTAAAQRAQEQSVERLLGRFDGSGNARETVRAFLKAGVDLVAERPNVFRFLADAQLSRVHSVAELLESGRPESDLFGGIVTSVIRAHGGDEANAEHIAAALAGAIALAVLHWLALPTVDRDRLVDELTEIVWGALTAALRARGVVLAPTDPLEFP